MSHTPRTVEALDWCTLALQPPDRVLIEASAGTGKTWSIGAIFLRLLLEREDLAVEKILVATFTEAAAQELRERLRARLEGAEHCLHRLANGERIATGKDDPVIAWLTEQFADREKASKALRRIELARIDFDRAPIATIHSFCRRVLRDFPLESGSSVGADELLDEDALLRECVEDFWRQRYLHGGDVDVDEADALFDKGPESLLRDVRDLLNRDAHILPADGMQAIRTEIEALRKPECIEQLRQWAKDKSLFASRRTALSNRLEQIADALESGDVATLGRLLNGVFEDAAIDEQQSESASLRLREQPLIQALQRLRSLLGRHTTFARGAVLAEACRFCKTELPRRAAQRRGSTFALQIGAVRDRLSSGERDFAERLFQAFPVTLVDEFQDTDARQFEIFDRIYRDADRAERGWLAMIGDPKQAIYGFRGGDIAAYLRVRDSVATQYRLDTNFRSSTAVIKACNALYAKAGDGFDDLRVAYQTVTPDGDADEHALFRDNTPVAEPFFLHAFRGMVAGDRDDPLTARGELEKLALDDCAARIVELLNDSSMTLGTTAVKPGDIAVLVPNNRHVAEIRRRLIARGVPCVGSGRCSVFDSATASELELFLHAVLHADDDGAVRGALTTRLLGANLRTVLAWQDDTSDFERELDRFARWHEMALVRGAFAVIADMLALRGAVLLSLPDGERIVTDLRHLAELLAQQEAEESGLEGAIAWFAAMRRGESDGEGDASDTRQLRIESDSARVQLLTLHAAKGLEFPIVFLPLAWRTADRKGQRIPNILHFHDADGRPCVDLGSTQFDAHLTPHFAEDLRERLRLLYVGITRAKYAVHVYWVDRDIAEDAPAWEISAIDVLIRQAQTACGLDFGEAALPDLARKLDGIAIVEPSTALQAKYVARIASAALPIARTPLPAARPFQWLHSFTGITRHSVMENVDTAAADEGESALSDEITSVEAESIELLALDIWRGRHFGNAVHNVLEARAADARTPVALAQTFAALGVHAQGGDSGTGFVALARMLERVRTADLGDGMRLANLPAHACVAEFEFRFPVDAPLAALRAVCAEHGFSGIWPAHASWPSLNGMLTGFADLIFEFNGRYHVLDYKTNRLGTRLSDYADAALAAAMHEHRYPLQALLYTVALHRYLSARLRGYTPERHLGESWYLFLRGVGLAPGAGVWRRRWPIALLRDLDDAFAGRQATA
ncbi:MAG: UvrD-helicase domain-containing protein [Rudaea sp.]